MALSAAQLFGGTNTVVVSSPGPQGARGTTFLFGNGAPTDDLGLNGDFYIDFDDYAAVYGPKASGVWPADPVGRFSQYTHRHTHVQGSAAETWSITHELGGYPSVTVVNSVGIAVTGMITYLSETEIQIDFTAPFSGIAYLT